jgi:hypothetical protein
MLYFIKGDSCENWGAMKMKLTTNASPSKVISAMEKDGWRSVTVSTFNAWRKQNSRPTPRAADLGGRAHQGDPCIYCGVAHDDVAVGDCQSR